MAAQTILCAIPQGGISVSKAGLLITSAILSTTELVASRADDFVFCKKDGSALDPDVLQKGALYPMLDRLGIPRKKGASGFHTLRHSAATIVNAQTGNLKLAQNFLGHSTIKMTADIYTHTSAEADHGELVGEPIGKFYAGMRDFNEICNRFLERKQEHRETQVLRGDGRTIFVEYTAKAHYLPGRHVAVLRDISRRKQAEAALRESEERFQQMATNILEIFWMLDAENMKVLYVNPAYEIVTGRSGESLEEDPKSYEEVIHPRDRVRVLSRLGESVQTGQLDEEFRITKPDGATRWAWVRGFPVRDSAGIVRRLVGTAQDISARKSAEEEIARSLDKAESAGAEADAFRKTTLALTQNLSMDYVLDTLLQSLLKLVPCESARILLVETDTRLFLARELQGCETSRSIPKTPATFDAKDSEFLMHVLAGRAGLLIPNTTIETEWVAFKGFSHLRSWLCVPLLASQQVLGLPSLGDTHVQAFTQEHLRLAKSLAIPAAVAIQNARLYEQAEIFRAELEQRLVDLERAQKDLREVRKGRELS